MNRRDILKGILAVPVVAALPAIAKEPEFKPVLNKDGNLWKAQVIIESGMMKDGKGYFRDTAGDIHVSHPRSMQWSEHEREVLGHRKSNPMLINRIKES